MEFEFSFIVDGISVDDESAVSALYENYDALLLAQSGRVVLVVTGEGPNSVIAAHGLINSLKNDFPQISVLRIDGDLVGVSDIAARVERTRQNVDQWVRGVRHKGDGSSFPASEGVVGRSLVWRWAEVNEWLETQGLGDGVNRPKRDEALMIDLLVSQSLQAMQQGRPALEVVAEQDERVNDRMAVMHLLGEAVQDRDFLDRLQALPRKDSHRLKVVCSVLLDPLSKVVEQLGPEELSGALAAISPEGELHLTPIAATRLPGTVPIQELGLGKSATVGDLILLQRNGRIDRGTPLALSFA
ncbi:helix-turn-helix transcriptional regulator [Streptomyces sp. NBC_00286]|uniref:helix-turn-helix transcriptional regulator n=1 Tax=Streptomyces sp. NBC_00286 TaxID=2975701 RepID=UPI002E28C5B0|nr:hypothetical protein [Streptomyces sp. NBC_00286]